MCSALTWISYCMCKLFTTNGFRNCAYCIAFSSGNPFEWNDTKQSQIGQFSTGSCFMSDYINFEFLWFLWFMVVSQGHGHTALTFKMTSSSNTTIRMYSNSRNRVKISFIGLDCVFLAIAQMPTSTCLPEFDDPLQSESMPSFESPPHKSMSPCVKLESECFFFNDQWNNNSF